MAQGELSSWVFQSLSFIREAIKGLREFFFHFHRVVIYQNKQNFIRITNFYGAQIKLL